MLRVRHLAVFRAVVKAGSISGAARLLYVSQPAVTKTIHLLEAELGLLLFLRVNGRLVLTPEAEQLIPEVERLFGNVVAVKNLADEIRDGFSGSISLATVSTLSATLVVGAIERFHRDHPRVRFDIRALTTRYVVDSVTTHQVDVGITDAPTSGGDMEVMELCTSEVGCVIRPSHPLAERQYLTPKDLETETLISYSEETLIGRQLREAFESAGAHVNKTFTVNHTHTAYGLVQAGVGIAVVDSFPMLSGAFPNLRILPFRPAMQTRPQVLFSNTRPVPLAARKFVSVLKEATEELIIGSKGMLKSP